MADFAVTRDQNAALQAWPDGLFAGGGPISPAQLRLVDGRNVVLDVERWHQPATLDDHDALARATGAVLDIGCGPGRHVGALQARGGEALGIDISPAAVRAARRRGANAVVASVWDRLAGCGYWQTALLLDGNIGIGGNPVTLLERTVSHLGGARRVIVELAGGHVAGPITVQVTHGASSGSWFRWALVTPASIHPVARASGLTVDELWTSAAGRSFAVVSPQQTAAQPEAIVLDRTATDPTASDGEGVLVRGPQSTLRSGGAAGLIRTADPPTPRRTPVRACWPEEPRPDLSRLEHGVRSDTTLTAPFETGSELGGVDG